jgi:hypothetical protein
MFSIYKEKNFHMTIYKVNKSVSKETGASDKKETGSPSFRGNR